MSTIRLYLIPIAYCISSISLEVINDCIAESRKNITVTVIKPLTSNITSSCH